MDRRNFLKAGLASTAVAMSGSVMTACAAKPAETVSDTAKKNDLALKLSLQEGKAPGET